MFEYTTYTVDKHGDMVPIIKMMSEEDWVNIALCPKCNGDLLSTNVLGEGFCPSCKHMVVYYHSIDMRGWNTGKVSLFKIELASWYSEMRDEKKKRWWWPFKR